MPLNSHPSWLTPELEEKIANGEAEEHETPFVCDVCKEFCQ